MSNRSVAAQRLILGPLWFLWMFILIPVAIAVGVIYLITYTVYLFTFAGGDIQKKPPGFIFMWLQWWKRLTSWAWDNAGWVVSGTAQSRGFKWLP